MTIFIGILIVLLTATGQILLKKGADQRLSNQFINRYVISGYMIFLVTIVFSYYLMKVIPLKYFTVIMSSSYVVVMVGAKIFLHEAITRDRILGTTLIAFGIFIFVFK